MERSFRRRAVPEEWPDQGGRPRKEAEKDLRPWAEVLLMRLKAGDQPFTKEAISSAKFSCFFSMPSPFSNRTAVLKVMAPPSSLAAWAI